jgi:hypothetical protein
MARLRRRRGQTAWRDRAAEQKRLREEPGPHGAGQGRVRAAVLHGLHERFFGRNWKPGCIARIHLRKLMFDNISMRRVVFALSVSAAG